VTWTAKKHGELIRLLKEFIEEHYEDYKGGDLTLRCRGIKSLWNTVLGHIEAERPDDGRTLEADNTFLVDLSPWYQIVQRHYGMEPYKATRWLVKQYYDYAEEEKAVFCDKFGGGTSDSIARRLYQKAKNFSERFAQEPDEKFIDECDAAVKEAGTDLYKLTFKMLRLWPEPSVYLKCRKINKSQFPKSSGK
jgi:hypothetical protein